jgi:hypothetical protein
VIAKVTVTDPPLAGAVALPDPETVPLFTVIWMTAPPQLEGRFPTVTLMTTPDDRFWRTARPAVVHRGAAAPPAPSLPVAAGRVAASPVDTSTRVAVAMVGETMRLAACAKASARALASLQAPRGRLSTTVLTADREDLDYPLMTTLMPVIEPELIAGENVAAKLVPVEGVVPVVSPSAAFAEPVKVIL